MFDESKSFCYIPAFEFLQIELESWNEHLAAAAPLLWLNCWW
jgi:hypothetical protein